MPKLNALALALVVWLCVILIGLTRVWQDVELKIFDRLTVLTAPKQSVLPITIVGIDELSFSQIDQRWPWPRSLYAKAVDNLVASGAAVIAFDVIFSEKSEADQDEAFAAAISRAGNVILAADNVYQESASTRQWLRVDPTLRLTQAGAATGLATVVLDGDTVIRQVPSVTDALWRQAIETLLRTKPGIVERPYVPQGNLIRHLGPAHTFPYVPIYQVLNGDPKTLEDHFRDQIVLIGRDVRSSPDVGSAQADLFATPFLGNSRQLTPGVEIHATLIENALIGQTITPAGKGLSLLLLTVAIILTLPALIRWHPLRSGLWIAALFGIVAVASYMLFSKSNFWIAPGSTLLALGLLYAANGSVTYLTELRRSQYIKSAFAKYVSPKVVEQMIAHPESLKLGGERRELTIMFADLQNFTTMSERLDPDVVARIINALFTELADIVMAENGTVDKFIGDAIMAFWGAPLDDVDHALHAARAAIAMQAAMIRLQPQFSAIGSGEVRLRVGLNSGLAIVGNMGSEKRFNYTAMGNTVNLASRLEGVNKFYGTNILLSESTASLLGKVIALRPVDRVRVKGKVNVTDIFTPCENPELVEQTKIALAAYRQKNWVDSSAAWTRILSLAPQDPLAKHFLERIAELAKKSLPDDWDGVTSLEKG
jgi:adenylate cyclase